MKRSTVIKHLKKMFPDIHGIMEGDDWGSAESIHLGDAAEGGLIDGLPAADYYNEFNCSVYDDFGVHTKLSNFLEKNGWHTEWYDGGTILAYED